MGLLARLRGLLAPPVRYYADEDEARVASTVHKIGLVLVPNALLIGVALWISLANPWPLLRLDRIYVRNARAHAPMPLPVRPWSHLSDHAPLAAELTL